METRDSCSAHSALCGAVRTLDPLAPSQIWGRPCLRRGVRSQHDSRPDVPAIRARKITELELAEIRGVFAKALGPLR